MSEQPKSPPHHPDPKAPAGRASKPGQGRLSITIRRCAWLYLAALLGLWLLIRVGADQWWLPTLVIFGPRWVWALPLGVLVPAAALARPRTLGLLAVCLILVGGPIMGYCLSWPSLTEAPPGPRLRVLTCNTDNTNLNAPALRALLDEMQPDVVALQEWVAEKEAPLFGQSTWQVRGGMGLCLATRHPISATEALTDEHGWRDLITRHDLETPAGTVHFFNLHLDTPREGLKAVLEGRWRGLDDLRANIRQREAESARVSAWAARSTGRVLLAGDFNMPDDSRILRHSWSRFGDAFRSAGLGMGQTKFTQWYGIRIDHVLTGPGWVCRGCWVGPDVGSDHRPVIADLVWVGPG
jgi:endonuclease/exonuclease/phosphatase (EEP) superfamily protein YafD